MSFWRSRVSDWRMKFALTSRSSRPFYPLSNYPWIIPLTVLLWVGVGVAAGIYREVHEEDLRRAFSDPLKIGIASTIILFAVTFALNLQYQPPAPGNLCAYRSLADDRVPSGGVALCRAVAKKRRGLS